MLGSVFLLFLAVALAVAFYAFHKRDPMALLFASILFMGAGLLVLDESPDSGVEETTSFFVQDVGDNNFNVELVKTFRNAGNDPSLDILGNTFFWGGIVGLMMSLGFLIASRKNKGSQQ